MSIEIKLGDALKHTNPCIIPHVCNDVGGYGSGFVNAINNISQLPRIAYQKWFNDGYCNTNNGDKIPFKLGEVQCVFLNFSNRSKIIANIIGQHSMGWDKENDRAPVRYWAIRKGLTSVKNILNTMRNSEDGYLYEIASPLLGTGLAGGHLDEVYSIINDLYGNLNDPLYTLYAFSEKDYKELASVRSNFLKN